MKLKCNICGENSRSHLWRCEDHQRCDVCGTKKNLCYRNRGLTCDACHAEIARKQVEAFDGDINYTSEIICPWCGDERSDSWEDSDEDTHYCENCENEYSHTRNVEVTYCTSKIDKTITAG